MGTPMTVSTTNAGVCMTGRSKKNLDARVWALFAGIMLIAVCNAHAEGSIEAGTEKARACQVCHGKGGHSTKETYPILAGQHAAYIRKQLHAFRDGTRKDPIMNGMAAPLSDQDIEDVAAFFHSNK
jgi:cytochrome c553